jgi:hypothetical protein
MSDDRIIVRKEGKPVAFKGQLAQYTRIGYKYNPQQYTPSCILHKRRCR